MKRLSVMLLAFLTVSIPGAAPAKPAPDAEQMREAPAALKPSRAYILLRSSRAKSGLFPITHALVRIPTDAEINSYRSAREAAFQQALPALRKKSKGVEPSIADFVFAHDGPNNAFGVKNGQFLEDGPERTFLIEVSPGDYVVYGPSFNGSAVTTCNCLGTVKFSAKPGVITNMGTLYADKAHGPSQIPQIESNVGRSLGHAAFFFGQAVKPADRTTPVPASLANLPVVAADYSAVGSFTDPGTLTINRLAPIPGILGYENGKPVDLKTGKRLE